MPEELKIKGIEEDLEEETSTYDPKSEYKKPALVEQAMRSCVEARGTQMKSAFLTEKRDKLGNIIETFTEDQRQVFLNRVKALQILLKPECSSDEKYQESIKSIKEKEEVIFSRFAYADFSYDQEKKGWVKTGFKYIPQLGEELLCFTIDNSLKVVKGGWDRQINAYYDLLVPLYDQILEELNLVISRIDDFAQKTGY